MHLIKHSKANRPIVRILTGLAILLETKIERTMALRMRSSGASNEELMSKLKGNTDLHYHNYYCGIMDPFNSFL
jgi:hypothetical protein